PHGSEHRLEFGDPILVDQMTEAECEPAALTKRINDVISDRIAAQPELWLWMHDRWKGTGTATGGSEGGNGEGYGRNRPQLGRGTRPGSPPLPCAAPPFAQRRRNRRGGAGAHRLTARGDGTVPEGASLERHNAQSHPGVEDRPLPPGHHSSEFISRGDDRL